MKITFDRVTKEPLHSLSKKEIKVIFDNIPEKWIDGFSSVRFCAAIHATPKFYGKRPVEINHSRLNIHSRGINKQQIIKEILRELAQENSGEAGLREISHNSMTKNQMKRLDQLVKPYTDKIVSTLRERETT